MQANILAFAGSVRKESFNRKVLNAAVEGARKAGATVTVADLRDFPMPIYDADSHAENGVPDAMRELRKLMMAANGLLIASPEYNTSITPLLKNTIDWLSQDIEAQGPNDTGSGYAPFAGKVCGLLGASNGGFGTIRALPHVSYILSNLGVFVLPVVAVPRVGSVLAPDGSVSDPKTLGVLHNLGARVAETVVKLKG
jgi:chromate reductase, NAD(P)H dehydrogenase (quinone)